MSTLPFLSGNAEAVTRSLWLFVTVFLTRGLFLFLLVWGMGRLIPGLSARARSALWFAVICGFLLLPTARMLVPVLHVTADAASFVASSTRLAAVPLELRESLEDTMVGAFQVLPGPSGGGMRHALSVAASAVWAAGVLLLVARMVGARVALGRMARAGRRSAGIDAALARVAGRTSVRRGVSARLHSRVAVPLTFGSFTPWIMLPEGATSWPSARLEAVLAHELAHVRRHDSLLNLLAQSVCALLWFIPLAWIARAFMLREAEISCDGDVLDQGFRRSEYASAILELGCAARGAFFSSSSLLARKSMVKERLLRILAPAGSRKPAEGPRRRRARVAALFLPLALIALTCSMTQSDRLLGTWVNTGGSGPLKYAWMDGGKGLQFARCYHSNDAGVGQGAAGWLADYACSSGNFLVEKKWSDPNGNTWYHVRTKWSSLDVPRFALIRLDPSGRRYESDESLTGYPQTLSGPIGDGMHQVYLRQ